MEIVGTTKSSLITASKLFYTEDYEKKSKHSLNFIPFNEENEKIEKNPRNSSGADSRSLGIFIQENIYIPESFSSDEKIIHGSIQFLFKDTSGGEKVNELNDPVKVSDNGTTFNYFLLSLVRKYTKYTNRIGRTCFSASILLVKITNGREKPRKNDTTGEDPGEIDNGQNFEIIEELKFVEDKSKELKLFILPISNKTKSGENEDFFKNRILLLSLNECISVFQIETRPFSSTTKIEIISTEFAVKSFRFAQFCPDHYFLAIVHIKNRHQSSFEEINENETPVIKEDPILSVLQFHEKFPRETVLNLPLTSDIAGENEGLSISYNDKFLSDPNVLNMPNFQMRFLAHSSGSAYLFQLHYSGKKCAGYSVNLLHYNKSISVELPQNDNENSIKFDVCMHLKGQFVIVVGWPIFVHILDVGPSHDPSHHLLFDYSSLMPQGLVFNCLISSKNSPVLNFVFKDLTIKKFELNSASLLPFIGLKNTNIQCQLAILHFLLYHCGDINASKRMIYDCGKIVGNLHLKTIYQEFLIGLTFTSTRKQLASVLESFLKLIPYTPFPEKFEKINQGEIILKLVQNSNTNIPTMISPSQRVFPHNVTDIWTILWENLHSKFSRYSHKTIAAKMILSLECYRPESLSRATTPTTPTTPTFICSSFDSMGTIFGRRAQELIFSETESCTANKHEYVFSINLRELSNHLLKEKRDMPIHCHSVAGKYCNALVDSARLLCHLASLTVHLQPSKNRDKGFKLIDSLEWETKLKLFLLYEHYYLALNTLAIPVPQGFTPFFAYLGFRVLSFEKFFWQVSAGTFDLQIDLVKAIMTDLKDSEEGNIAKKLHLISLLGKTRANRVLNGWSHPKSVCIRARQHSSDLLSGVALSQMKKSVFINHKKKKNEIGDLSKITPLDTFFNLLSAKANATDIDLGLLTEATIQSMSLED